MLTCFNFRWLLMGVLLLGLPLIQMSCTQAQQSPNNTAVSTTAVLPTVVSPEVLADHRVVIRIFAPKATEVAVHGDWMPGESHFEPLAKDAQGVWSATFGPLTPDLYYYEVTVDGVRGIDPKNAFEFLSGEAMTGTNGLSGIVTQLFLVPGEQTEFLQNKPVPHGAVQTVWYHSASLNLQRQMHIYTPPDYGTSTARYPVLYLLAEDDPGWITVGRSNFILDNLIAGGKAKPMIIVMPADTYPGQPEGSATTLEADRFGEELLGDIIPYVEKNYRVQATRNQRALAGHGKGGYQTIRIGIPNLEMFGALAVFSAGVNPKVEKQLDEMLKKQLDDEALTKGLLFYVAFTSNDDEGATPNAQNLVTFLDRHHVKYTLRPPSEGLHNWIPWRHFLADFAPLLFR
jgi:enterochelin esterase-like enzyme